MANDDRESDEGDGARDGGHRGRMERFRAVGVLNSGGGPTETDELRGVESGVETGSAALVGGKGVNDS